MNPPHLEPIAETLRQVAHQRAFAACHQESAQGLGFTVEGVGECRLPLSQSRIEALLSQATPSPFGYRDQTLHDRTIRDSWEIPGSRVHLDSKLWSMRFMRGLNEIVRGLGFPPDVRVEPKLQKLLLYETGQFFARHRDSEKAVGMAGTLVVVLPSRYEGGEVWVSHAGEQTTFATASESRANKLSFLGFYADCVHETTPVQSGCRVSLTFSLEVMSHGRHPLSVDALHRAPLEELQQCVEFYFRSRQRNWLAYLLEHQYSRQSLDWSHLKAADRSRTDALRHVAHELDCECFLVLGDGAEIYSFIESEDRFEEDDVVEPLPYDPYIEHGMTGMPGEWATLHWATDPWFPDEQPWPGDSLAIEEPVDIDSGIGPILGREVEPLQWLNEQGTPCVGPQVPIMNAAIVTTAHQHDWTSFDASFEPWRGNEGGTAEKWFHVALVVLVPRDAEQRPEALPTPPRRRPRASGASSPVLRRRPGQRR
ncbi:MAG: 2OG-Fe(II) oxygenase [Myxococcota bacterium]